eukprot:14417032-Alexandrium_andersonii.AAC.1
MFVDSADVPYSLAANRVLFKCFSPVVCPVAFVLAFPCVTLCYLALSCIIPRSPTLSRVLWRSVAISCALLCSFAL